MTLDTPVVSAPTAEDLPRSEHEPTAWESKTVDRGTSVHYADDPRQRPLIRRIHA